MANKEETPQRVPLPLSAASIVKRWSVFYRRKAQSVLAFLQTLFPLLQVPVKGPSVRPDKKQLLAILKQGAEVWNEWRKEHADSGGDLSGANLGGADLKGADLSGFGCARADFRGADLKGADLSYTNLMETAFGRANLKEADLRHSLILSAEFRGADLSGANLSEADLSGADLSGANLSGANLSGANLGGVALGGVALGGANLEKADLRGATLRNTDLSGHNFNNVDFSGMDLSGANLNETSLIKANFSHANLSNCSIYGIAAWDIQLDEHTVQKNLVITPPDQPVITVDNLKVAQFIYLLLNNKELREVIDTITSKVVLILGRFTPDRKAILDALRETLREHNYSPIVFDFEIPGSRDITETVSLLARMARFVIADLTDAKSIPQELSVIVPDLPSVPVQPVLQTTDKAYSMFEHWMRYSSVLKIYYYTSLEDLLPALNEHIIAPAEQKVQELKRPQ